MKSVARHIRKRPSPAKRTDDARPAPDDTSSDTSGDAPSATDDAERDKAAGDDETTQMSLREHLQELRKRLVRCLICIAVAFVGVFTTAPYIRSFVTGHIRAFLPAGGDITFVQLTEPFLVDMHLAFVLGIFVSSPFIFYQIWAFVAPGLYASERRHIVPLALCSAVFFLAGGAFCATVALPLTYKFFIAYGQDSARPLLTLASVYKFSLRLILGFGFVFEMPLFSFFLAKLRIITAERLRLWRKYAILGNFIVAALITPPDVLSQLLLAGPLLILYELSIVVAAFAAPASKPAPHAS